MYNGYDWRNLLRGFYLERGKKARANLNTIKGMLKWSHFGVRFFDIGRTFSHWDLWGCVIFGRGGGLSFWEGFGWLTLEYFGVDCSQSAIFPWDFQDLYALIELLPSSFATASATWGECLKLLRGVGVGRQQVYKTFIVHLQCR